MKSSFLLWLTFCSFCGLAQQEVGQPILLQVPNDQFVFRQTGSLPQTINEASGLETFNNSIFWTHNDGGLPVLFGLDITGNLIKTVHLANKNKGWEDLAKDKDGNLYIGSFGNNKSDKKELKIFSIPNPDSIATDITLAKVIRFSFDDQQNYPPTLDKNNFDVDAFFCINDSLYLFTKNRTMPYNHIVNVYALPKTSGKHVARKVDAFRLEGAMVNNWITGADISKDKTTIALLFHNRIITIEDFLAPNFSKGVFKEYKLNHYSHKAGVVFTEKDELIVVDEREMGIIGGNIYQFNYQ
jgi:hypothetical protein